MLFKIADYFNTHSEQIIKQLGMHMKISLTALLIAAAVGIPCGYLASKSKVGESIVTTPFEMLRLVPSLALLIIMIPIIGTGVTPAVIAMVILATPPVLLNTIVGFNTVPEIMIEAARGIGMTDQEILCRVRIPLALPMILAGLRTGLIEVIASTTLAAKIGAGGLGEIIFTGLGLNRAELLLTGGTLVAALSLMAGMVFDGFTHRILSYKYTKK